MVFDREHKVVLMYGNGDANRPGGKDELWAYDLETNTWTPRNDNGRPRRGGIPVMVYDARNRMPILFSPGSKSLEAFAYTWEKNTWHELPAEGDPPPSHTTQQGAYDPVGHQTFLVNGIGGGRKFYGTYRFRHVLPETHETSLPAPVEIQVVVTAAGQATLTWEAVSEAASYVVYRGKGEVPWKVRFQRAGETRTTNLTDGDLAQGTIHYYFVRPVDAKGREGEASLKVRTQPPVPKEPVVSVLAKDQVHSSWQKSPAPDVIGYNLYRSTGTETSKLNQELLDGATFTDRFAIPGNSDTSTRYVVKAANRLGVESGPSPWATTIPTEPRGVQASDEDGRVVVRWQPNPQKNIKGYNVYRVDKGSGDPRKLAIKIAELVQDTQFVDTSKTDQKTCKYYITAVDALGQEGYASYGAWFRDR